MSTINVFSNGDGMQDTITYGNSGPNRNRTESITIPDLKKVMASNKIFTKGDIDYYNKFNRYGFIDPYNTVENVLTEYLFFTKPDMYLLSDEHTLNPVLNQFTFFKDAFNNHREALMQLQGSLKTGERYNPFMYLLSNSVESKLDLPTISSEANTSTPNMQGIDISYRSQSHKSNAGYDFSLSFKDTTNLDIYYLVKSYDELVNLYKSGEAAPFRRYIVHNIDSTQFSAYKFLIAGDGETILFYAKLTGCFFVDVPRSEFGDPTEFGKYSLSFHSNFVEDMNPEIITEFNRISPIKAGDKFKSVFDFELGGVDNTWVRFPYIQLCEDARANRYGVKYNYRMKWTA